MVEKIEELGAEPQTLPFPELERLAECEVDVHLLRADDAIAWGVAITSTTIDADNGRRLIGSGFNPVCNLGGEAARI